ncbi:hypothetical protein KSP40_PGU003035 [Platanthera guangdongensis]|uniref:Uncharacterized protein n=1 Tax=Platanthera guangdongensis TaxID=2320717 RepID=A0ABR2MK23_9ASPA
MEAPGTSSNIVPLNSLEIESAWHLLSILIQQGCPPRLLDLASRSSLGPNLVEFLCRIPGSPLTITPGGFINFSDAGGEAFVEFVTRAVALYVPRDVFWFLSLKRVSCNVSVTYVRKRKAQSPGNNADLLFPSSKKRSSLKHKRGMLNLIYRISICYHAIQVTFDVASLSDKEQHTVGMDAMHCCSVGLDRTHSFSALHDLNYFEFGDIGRIREEDTRASTHYVTNSVVPHDKIVDFSYEYASRDDGLNASIMKEHALQRPEVVEHDFRPLLDGILDQPSLMNQSLVEDYLGEDCNSLSLELGLVSGIPDVHSLERLNSIEKDFASLMDRVWDETAMDHISQYASLLACSNLPAYEAIDERNLYYKDDELVKSTCEFGGGDQNSAAQEFMLGLGLPKESTYVSEVKHGTACEPSVPNNILAGSNIASNNISSREGQDKNIENFSKQKLIPKFESLIMEKEHGSGNVCILVYEGNALYHIM